MIQVRSIRIATVVALGVLLFLCGTAQAGQELGAGTAEAIEVRVLEAQVPPDPGQGERYDVLYRMEVISVLRSNSRLKPGHHRCALLRLKQGGPGQRLAWAKGPSALGARMDRAGLSYPRPQGRWS